MKKISLMDIEKNRRNKINLKDSKRKVEEVMVQLS